MGAWGRVMLFAAVVAMATAASAGTVAPRTLVEVADLGNPVLSPDGRMVAYRLEQASVERDTYDTVWYVQGVDGEAPPRRIADGGVPLRDHATGLVSAAPAVWSPDGRWIYYRALLEGRVAVWRAAVDGSGAEPVTTDPADVRAFVLDPDGRALLYSVGATREQVVRGEQAENDRGIRVDEATFIGAGLFRSSRVEGRAATQRLSGQWFTPGPLMGDLPDQWRRVDALPGGRVATDAEPPPSGVPEFSGALPTPWRWSRHPDDERIAVLMRVGEARERRQKPGVELAMISSAKATRLVTCRAAMCRDRDISDIQWRPGSDEVLFTVTDRRAGKAQSIYRWNTSTGAVSEVVHSRGLLRGSSQRFHDVPCAVSFNAMVCVAAEADRPPRLEAIDLADGRRRVLHEPNEALARQIARSAPAKLLRWTDSRGDTFTGWLFAGRVQEGSGPPPLFANYYDCHGFLRGGVGDEWPLATMASAGISALCINGNPAFKDAAENYAQATRAVESVVNLLAGQGEIDPTRVGMGGLSYGSEVTMWTLMRSELLAAASVSSPSITPNWYLFNSLRGGFREIAAANWQLGAPDETPEQWKALSPVFNLDRISAPVLFQMAEQEYMAALEYALPLVRAGRADVHVFPGEPHIKFGPRHKLAAYERNLDWFRFWLQGYERESPQDPDQYRVWRLMKAEMG